MMIECDLKSELNVKGLVNLKKKTFLKLFDLNDSIEKAKMLKISS